MRTLQHLLQLTFLSLMLSSSSHAKTLRQFCAHFCKKKLSVMSTQQLNMILQKAQEQLTYSQRLRLFSRLFIGTPYRFGPLGEGAKGKVDRDPIYRRDRVDCVTYIETTMAFASARSEKEAIQTLQKIRYRNGWISFATRNHFTAPQWIIENRKQGWLVPLTPKIAQSLLKNYTQRISKNFWDGQLWESRLPPQRRPKTYTIQYMPLGRVHQIESRLPNIAWMGEVFHDPKLASTILHVGFVVRQRGQIFFRHANVGRKGVRQELLRRYIRKRMRQNKTKAHPVLGFVFERFHLPRALSRPPNTRPMKKSRKKTGKTFKSPL